MCACTCTLSFPKPVCACNCATLALTSSTKTVEWLQAEKNRYRPGGSVAALKTVLLGEGGQKRFKFKTRGIVLSAAQLANLAGPSSQ